MALSNKEKLGYGVGAMGQDLSYGLVNSFLMIYFTDQLHIAPWFLSVVFFGARIWDGINDPMMGTLVDNTKTRWGKFRPWIMLGAVLNAIVLVLLFTNPGFTITSGAVNVGVYVYAAVLYVFWGMSYTIVDIPYWSLVPALTSDPKERNIIATVPRFFSGLGQMIIAALTITMISVLGRGNEANGYQRWAMVAGVIYILVTMITVCSTKERVKLKRNDSFSLKKAVKIIRSNDQLLIFILTAICFNTGWYLTNGLGVYYFKYVVEKPNLYSVFAVLVGAGQFIGLVLFPILSNKIGKFKAIKIFMTCSFVGYLAMFLFGPILNNFIIFAAFGILCCAGIGAMFVAETVMLADIVDYGEFKLGVRTDSIVFSMKSFLLKAALSIQALVIMLGLQFSHYQENVVPQAPLAKNTISVMMFLLPPLFIIVAFLLFTKKYKLHGSFMNKVSEAVNKKHTEEEAALSEN